MHNNIIIIVFSIHHLFHYSIANKYVKQYDDQEVLTNMKIIMIMMAMTVNRMYFGKKCTRVHTSPRPTSFTSSSSSPSHFIYLADRAFLCFSYTKHKQTNKNNPHYNYKHVIYLTVLLTFEIQFV